MSTYADLYEGWPTDAHLCGRGRTPTTEDLAIVANFAAYLRGEPTQKEHHMNQVTVHPSPLGGWAITARAFDTQEQAIDAGRDLARDLQGELVIHGEDGQIREKDSHGNDPKDIKG